MSLANEEAETSTSIPEDRRWVLDGKVDKDLT